MEIKVSTEGMLRVLVEAGMRATKAKAVILDLLLETDGGTAKRVEFQKTLAAIEAEREPAYEEPEIEETEEVEATPPNEVEITQPDPSPEKPIKRPRMKRKKIDFGAFGGPSPTPR